MQEAVHCDQSLSNTYRSSARNKTDHVVSDFTKLMLEGNVHAAVHWVTERVGGGFLLPTDSIDYNHPQLRVVSKTVLDMLHLRYPNPSVPPVSILQSFDNFPYLDDVDKTGTHTQSVACGLQGSADLADVMLPTERYSLGDSSTRLCNTVASAC